ncbi:type 1 fimbria pilin [Raoultella sp. BIGb0399]|uniref:fimbrial protein n=1 Tax=Raoultella sp. BIGb0399 TaxID=2485119 RepID=UPI000F4BD5D9|nr:fimbrial protein [Raoultella sp. BIGb0399]ROS15277.1 type 1 fimbria pilin [Raoultella sp. BIGb0399]
MKRKYLCPLPLAGLFALTASASAATYNLQMTGIILSRTCEVESKTQTVNIGQFAARDFSAAGSVSAAKAFNIKLTGCGSAATGALLSFSGASDGNNPSLLALSDTAAAGGMASGIGVEILDSKQQTLAINSPSPPFYALEPGDNTLSFYLRYKSTQDVVTAGNATAVMYFDLQYQ